MAALGLASLPVRPPTGFSAGSSMLPLGAPQLSAQQSMDTGAGQNGAVPQQPPPQPTPLDASAITIKLATLAGERFKEVFYTVFDSHRTDLPRFFLPQSVLVWEGTPCTGAQASQLFELLPSSKHTIATFDVQPVTGAEMRGIVNTLLVTVTGTVAWGMIGTETAAKPHGFYHTFVLERSPTPLQHSGKHVHHVVSASMRTRHIETAQQDGHGQAKKKRSQR